MVSTENNNLVVYGIYKSRVQLESALDELKRRGFRSADISVLFSSPDTTKAFAHTKSTKAPEGTAVGGATGVLFGGILGWLAGIGTIAIPGAGPFIAAGPIMGALSGIGAGGLIGGITGALIGMGVPEYEAQRYNGQIEQGGILLSVHADNEDWRDRAKIALEETGAQDISSSSEAEADFPTEELPRSKTL